MERIQRNVSEPASRAGGENLVEVFAHSAAYTLVQSPIDAVAQLVDKVADTNILPKVHLIDAPEAVQFSLSNPSWYVQQFGNATAMAAHLYFLNKAMGGSSNLTSAGSELGMTARAATQLTAKSAGVGALYSGVFTPVTGEGNFWQARAINTLAGAATFATMSASAIGTKSLGQAVQPMSKVAGNVLKNDIAAGALSGIPAGIVSADAHSLLAGAGLASGKERFEAAYGFAVIGAGLSAAHAVESKVTQGSAKLKQASGSISIFPQIETARTVGVRSPLYMMSEGIGTTGKGGLGQTGVEAAKIVDSPGSKAVEPVEAKTVVTEPVDAKIEIDVSRTEPTESTRLEPVEPAETAEVSSAPAPPKRLPFYNESMAIAKQAAKERSSGNIEAADKLADEAMTRAGLEGNSSNYATAIQEQIPEGNWRTYSWRRRQPAEPALKQALALMSTGYGPGHPKVVNTLELLIERIDKSYNTHNLQPVHRRLLESKKAEYGTEHPSYADELHRMADFQSYHGKYDNAIALLKKAGDIRQQAYGTDGLPYVQTLSDIAQLHINKRQMAEAETILTGAKDSLLKTQQGDRLLTATVLDQLAEVYIHTGRRAEAEPLLIQALETGRYAPDAANRMRSSMTHLAGIYLWWGRIPEAQALYERSMYRFGLPPKTPGVTGQRTVFDEINSTGNPYLETMNQLGLGGRRSANDYYIREILTRKYSWAIPNEEALSAVAAGGPVVEVGAGTGYWAALLKARGVDVLAYDKHPVEGGTNHYHPSSRESWTKILNGDETVAGKHPDRTLFLSWPVYDEPVAYNALMAYKGNRVVYIGEGWGGCTADNKFHTLLDRDWKLETEVNIPQWDGIHDWLRVFTRNTPSNTDAASTKGSD